jgi:hypothetical protein
MWYVSYIVGEWWTTIIVSKQIENAENISWAVTVHKISAYSKIFSVCIISSYKEFFYPGWNLWKKS